MDWIKKSVQDSIDVKTKIVDDEALMSEISKAVDLLADTFKNGGQSMICGNGGSTCDAMHIAEEFTGRYDMDRKPLPMIPLTDAAHITCTANDYGFDAIFSRGVEAYGKKDDVLIALSTSGNSNNVVRAVEKAKIMGVKTICLTGESGGKLAEFADVLIKVPSTHTARIQESHITVGHIFLEGVEQIMFGS